MRQHSTIPHLFRTEYRKVVSVLCTHLGIDQIATAEDIASETFFTAAQTWGIEGLPANPTAWLYRVAKNKAVNQLRRSSVFRSRVLPVLQGELEKVSPPPEIDLSAQNITDSQLRMMFVVCDPSIPSDARIGLSLKILCGFGIEEIATAFLENRETIYKRLARAKKKLRDTGIDLAMPQPSAISGRLQPVLRTIYLLFNEGYYSRSGDITLRKDICFEAIRLCAMLAENETTAKPETHALLALMCFHASRFDARVDATGEMVLYEDQEPALWDKALISKGICCLARAASGPNLSTYHLQAGIAYWHTKKEDTQEKWQHILHFYNQLLQVEYSPVAALNRTYAVARVKGKEAAIRAAELLNLQEDPFYFTLLGELYCGIDAQRSENYFRQAHRMAGSPQQKAALARKFAVAR